LGNLKTLLQRLPPGPSALVEVGLLFLPAIPAYLWLWPNLQGDNAWIAQALVYVYFLAGAIFIGRRRWSWGELGFNPGGLWLSLGSTLALLLGRLFIILSVRWKLAPPPLDPARLALDVLYYFGLVALVEELLFRGLIYRALESWGGVRWALWGSSAGFMLWHIFGQGPLIGLTTLVIGLVFALLRWRAGSILGLIVLHGLWDLQSVLQVPGDSSQVLAQGRPELTQPALAEVGTALLVLVPLYLWLVHPRLRRRWAGRAGGSASHPKEA
jgi:membrane protease YdiL (CAAX protease family)